MLINYLKIAFRSLIRKPVYSFINIAGLATGLACVVLIFLWVNDELSWDDFNVNKHAIYKVMINNPVDNGISTQEAVPLPLVQEFKTTAPEVKYSTSTDWGDSFLLSVGDKKLYKKGYFVGEDFLKMFSFPVIKGAPEKQLMDPSSMIITTATAKVFFGEEDPIGKVIRVNDGLEMKVTGVVDDVPSNSTFQFECLLPFATYMNQEPWVKSSLTNWGNNSFNIYIQLNDNANVTAFEQRVKKVIQTHEKNDAEVTFFPMDRWRLFAVFENGKSVTGGIIYVRIFSIIAIFILVIACINFMNLSTARSEHRAREVGIRKSIGSRRKDLVVQFLGETFLITLLSAIVAIGIVEIILPFYNDLVNKSLSINFSNPLWWTTAIAVLVVTGLLAGSYPALYLSSFQPAAVLKGKSLGKSASLPRKGMVTLQFFFSIILIIATLVVYQQLEHLRNRPSGYEKENLVLIENVGDILKNFNAIKESLIRENAVESMTTSSSPVTTIYAYMGIDWEGKGSDKLADMAFAAVGYDYTKTIGIKLLEGRDFTPNFNDSASMMINKAAADYIGFEKPLGSAITYNNKKYRVVGIVENVVMASAHRSVAPMVFIFDPAFVSDVSIRLPKVANKPETIAKIEKIFKQYNPAYPFQYRFADDEFNRKFSSIEMIGRLANLFASLAIAISCLGLFGLAAFTAEQRTKEIGIRKVLGASVAAITVLLTKEFTKLIVVAFVLATPLAVWGLNSWLQQYQYRISIEVWMIVLAGILALTIALVTVGAQAIRAAMADPVESLKSE